MTETPILREQFEGMMAASYGPDWRERCSEGQKLDMENAYMAGAQCALLSIANDVTGLTAKTIEAELRNFGNRIIQRYKDAGLL